MNQGISSAARQVQSLGRGPDTMLAHISPDEARFIDHLQGGTRTNPHTGLPEYGLLGNIIKAVVRAAATIGGFVVTGGNPLGAAAGSAVATKLTGGSWSDAAKAGVLSGATAGIGNAISSGGQAIMSNSTLAASAPTSSLAADAAAAGNTGWSTALSAPVAGSAAAPAASTGLFSGLSNAASGIGGLTGISSGLSAIGKLPPEDDSGRKPPPLLPPPIPASQSIDLANVLPSNRQYHGYEGDYNKYGEEGGGMGHLFFDPVNAPIQFRTAQPEIPAQPLQDQNNLEGLFLARGGRVRGYSFGGPAGPLGGHAMNQPSLDGPRMPTAASSPAGPGLPGAGAGQPSDRQAGILRAALTGYTLAGGLGFARGGHVRGIGAMSAPSPAAMAGSIQGPGDGVSDSVPAMLSQNEHVIDAGTIAMAGNGSSDAGHKVFENIKQQIRSGAGQKKPFAPSPKINTAPHAVAAMVQRAKRKAGVTKISPRMA